MREFAKQINYILKIISKDITFFGGVAFYGFVVALFFSIGFEILSVKLITAVILAYIITVSIRMFYYKTRPDGQKFSNFIEKLESSSFPSMHAIKSFLLFGIIGYELHNMIIGTIFFIIFLLVAASRIYLKRHYFIDVLAGSLIGLLISIFIELIV